MAKVNTFNVPYPDFKLLDVIDPDQFDANNEEIVNKVNEIIENMLNADGDFLGTWHGLTPGEVSEAINGGRLDLIEPIVEEVKVAMAELKTSVDDGKVKTDTSISDLKRVSKNTQQEVANLNLYIDANNRVKSGYTFGTNFDALFNMEIDYTRTTATSNLVPTQTIIPVVSSDGFKVGQEVTIYDDVNIERTKITGIVGTTLTVGAITKEFKINAVIARTTMTHDDKLKSLHCGGYVKEPSKQFLGGVDELKGMYRFSVGTSASYYSELPLLTIPSTPSDVSIANKVRLAFELDVMIPYVSLAERGTGAVSYPMTLFSQRADSNSTNGFSLSYICDTPHTEQYPDGYFRAEGSHYVVGKEHTLVIGLFQYTYLVAPSGTLKEYYGKTINLKLEIDLTNKASDDALSMVSLYINNKRIPLEIGFIHASGSVKSLVFTNLMKFLHLTVSNGVHDFISNAKLSRFVVYDGFSYDKKLIEYDFANIVNNQIQDTSGNGRHITLKLPSGSSKYSWEIINKEGIVTPIKTHDVRFTVPLKSKDFGVWVSRDSKLLTSTEGMYGDEPLELTLSSDTSDAKWKEDQFIGSRSESEDTEVRLTFERNDDSNFPRIPKIVGGVF